MVRKWTPDLKELDFDLARLSVWVLFRKISLELFTHNGIDYTASFVGFLQYMDRYTAERKQLKYATACVANVMEVLHR